MTTIDAAIHSIRTTDSMLSARTAIALLVADEVSLRLAAAPTLEDAIGALERSTYAHGKVTGTPAGLDLAAARERDRNALRTAITAHVEAEIARRLACAPGVGEAIFTAVEASKSVGFARGSNEDCSDALRALDAALPILRTAIAADKARAVAESRPTPSAPKSGYYTYAVRVVITDGITLTRETDVSGLWSPELESFAGRMLIDLARPITDAERAAPPVARWARPTPDEARRLVEEYGNAVVACIPAIEAGARGDGDAVNAMADVIDRGNKTLAALLRALGVRRR